VVRELSPLAEAVIARFMPGGLTVVLPAQPHLPPILTGGGDTVAVRIPDHPAVQRVAAGIGYPLAVSSANRSGEPECRTAAAAAAQLGEEVALILDGGAIPVTNLASTVLNLSVTPPRLLREGAIRYDTLRGLIPSLTRT
jgi:L-threonylcarbamoyladenylate synthase